MMKVIQALRLLLFLLPLNIVGCLTPIDNPAEQTGGRLVVSGQISNLNDRSRIQLGRTSPDQRLPVPEAGAEVRLIDEEGYSYQYNEDYSDPGTYYLYTVNSGLPDITYHLEITLSSGETYASQTETLPASSGFDATHYDIVYEDRVDLDGIVVSQPFLKIYSNATLPTSENDIYVKWNTEECYLLSPTDFPDPFGSIPPPCFITQNADPQNVVLYDGSTYDTDKIDDLLICSRLIDQTFHEKHYFTIYQSSITAEAHEYWRKVNIVANQTGSIFDTPPAEINGNVYNINNPDEKVYGYFQAVNESYTRFYLLPGDIPFRINYSTCTFSNERSYESYPSACLDCLSVRNSSYQRPDWF